MTVAPPPLAPDLQAGLRRLKLATVRAMAPEVLQTAKVQRWAPEELLRTSSRPISKRETPPTPGPGSRRPASRSPNPRRVQGPASSVPSATLRCAPPRTSASSAQPARASPYLLVALGHAAVTDGLRVRHFAAADLVESLHRSLPTAPPPARSTPYCESTSCW